MLAIKVRRECATTSVQIAIYARLQLYNTVRVKQFSMSEFIIKYNLLIVK